MTKKDIIDLLKPSIIFVAIAFAAFFMFYKTHHAADDVIAEQQRLNWMVDQVQSGKQLTTDKALKIFQLGRDSANSANLVLASQAEVQGVLGCAALYGIGWQVFVVFRVRNRLSKK
jgi:hypothetical protein